MRLVFDLEADDLLFEWKKIHCISTQNLDTGELYHFGPSDIRSGALYLKRARLLIGHNITGYDIPLLEQKMRVSFEPEALRDTLVMSKLFYPNRGVHSLESWGQVFGESKEVIEDFSEYNEKVKKRCDRDVHINAMTYNYMVDDECKGWNWLRSILLEQAMSYWQAYQELKGVAVDKEHALRVVERLDKEIGEIDEELRPQLPKVIKKRGAAVSKPFKIDGSYTKAVEDFFKEVEGE